MIITILPCIDGRTKLFIEIFALFKTSFGDHASA